MTPKSIYLIGYCFIGCKGAQIFSKDISDIVLRLNTLRHGKTIRIISTEPLHEISNNVVCATGKASDQPAHTRSLIRAFASRLSIL